MSDKPGKKMVEPNPRVAWECTSCGLQFKENLRYCPQCNYTVYRPVFKSEKN